MGEFVEDNNTALRQGHGVRRRDQDSAMTRFNLSGSLFHKESSVLCYIVISGGVKQHSQLVNKVNWRITGFLHRLLLRYLSTSANFNLHQDREDRAVST